MAPYIQSPGEGMKKTVTMLPGDGIGPELTQVVQRVFQACNVPVEFEIIKNHKDQSGNLCPSVLESIRKNKVAIKGAFQSTIGPSKTGSLNMKLRQDLDLYASVVSIQNIPHVKGIFPDMNLTIIRENTEGEYSGLEHSVVDGVVESIKLISRSSCLRIAKYAFEYAYLNNRKRVTAVHKANIMKRADGLFLECAREIAKFYPQIEYREIIVDNCCMQMVSNPSQFDVMVTPNLYGSILGNIASGLVAGPGVSAGANVGREYAVFEQGVRHVGADIANKDLANPIGMLLSSSMMLRRLQLPFFADRIENAISATLANPAMHTHDMRGAASTSQFTDAVISALQ